MDVDCQETINELRSELADERSEHAVTRAYYRQVDDAYNKEAEELADMIKEEPREGRKQDGRQV